MSLGTMLGWRGVDRNGSVAERSLTRAGRWVYCLRGRAARTEPVRGGKHWRDAVDVAAGWLAELAECFHVTIDVLEDIKRTTGHDYKSLQTLAIEDSPTGNSRWRGVSTDARGAHMVCLRMWLATTGMLSLWTLFGSCFLGRLGGWVHLGLVDSAARRGRMVCMRSGPSWTTLSTRSSAVTPEWEKCVATSIKYSRGDVEKLIEAKLDVAGPLLHVVLNGIDAMGGVCFGFDTGVGERSKRFMTDIMNLDASLARFI